MAKQDVLDAINSTIVQNDIKAITAQSLNNVLTMMVENAGEGGSGDGALRIMVPDTVTGLNETFIEAGEFSLSVWEQMKVEITELGMDTSLYDDAFNTCFTHNAEVYQTLLGKLESNEGTYVILDQSLIGSVGFKTQLDFMINSIGMGSIESSNMSTGQLAMCNAMDIKISGLDDSIKEEIGLPEGVQIMIAPIYSMGGYPDTLMMSLLPDGSILFESSISEIDMSRVYIPYDNINDYPSNDVVIPDEYLNHNASLVSYSYSDEMDKKEKLNIIEYMNSDGSFFRFKPRVAFISYSTSNIIVEYWDGYHHKLYRSTIKLDGSVNTVEVTSISTAQVL